MIYLHNCFYPIQPEWHIHTERLLKIPSEPFRSSIAYVYQLNFKMMTGENVLLSGIPDGCIDLIFNLNGDTHDCYIIPSTKERTEFSFNVTHEYFGIRLLPLQMIFSFDMPLSELNSYQKIPLFAVIPSLLKLYELLLYENSLEERLQLIEKFIYQNDMQKLTPSNTIKYCLHIAYSEKGRTKLTDLEQLTCYSSRHLRNVFYEELGISPKSFLDMIYFQFALNEIINGSFSLEKHLLDYNIYDVSHFYKKFKKVLNMTPKAYVENIQKNINS